MIFNTIKLTNETKEVLSVKPKIPNLLIKRELKTKLRIILIVVIKRGIFVFLWEVNTFINKFETGEIIKVILYPINAKVTIFVDSDVNSPLSYSKRIKFLAMRIIQKVRGTIKLSKSLLVFFNLFSKAILFLFTLVSESSVKTVVMRLPIINEEIMARIV
jgi:hypothetical protein